MHLFTFFGCKVCHNKLPILDYWQFTRFHSLYFAIAKWLLIPTVSLGRRFVSLATSQKIILNYFLRQSTSALPKSAIHINRSLSRKHQVLNLFSACQIKDLKRRHRSVLCPARLAPRQADTGTSHRLTHLNLRDISTHIKM